MPFIHAPIFWLGLGCVSLPIIIHLLNRKRFRIRPWAAMQFLLDSVRKNRRRLRIEEMILLLLKYKIDPRIVSKTGVTALDVARESKNAAAIKILSSQTK